MITITSASRWEASRTLHNISRESDKLSRTISLLTTQFSDEGFTVENECTDFRIVGSGLEVRISFECTDAPFNQGKDMKDFEKLAKKIFKKERFNIIKSSGGAIDTVVSVTI